KCEVCKICRMLLWCNSRSEVIAMSVCIDETRHDCAALAIDDFRTGWNIHRAGCTNFLNEISFNEYHTILNHLVTIHGNDARIGKCYHSFRLIGLYCQADGCAMLRQLKQRVRRTRDIRKPVCEIDGIVLIAKRIMQLLIVGRPMKIETCIKRN